MTNYKRKRRGLEPIGWAASCVLWWAVGVLPGCARPVEVRLESPERIEQDRSYALSRLFVANPSDDGAMVIERDHVVLDLTGSELIGAADDTPADEYVGRGIVVRGAKGVTIRNAKVRGFKVGIYAEDSPGLRIENCDVSRNYRQRLKSTTQREHLDDWLWGHENDEHQWLRYGAGIYLLRCDGATVTKCRARNGQNGICLDRTNDTLIVENDISFMSGWGLAMWRSSRCRVVANRFDYCVRGYSHGVYARGQDSTGILVYEQCNENVFAYNRATHGGDGFFLYAGHETTQRTGEGGCNHNIVYRNDFSFAVANGIEATFSDENYFVENKLHHCVHGIWGGYSTNSIIRCNDIADCDNGISIEHGRGNRIEGNDVLRCGKGVWLWWDDDRDLIESAYGRTQGHESRSEIVRRNLFEDCKTGLLADTSTELAVEGNVFERCETVMKFVGETTMGAFQGNVFHSGRIESQASQPIAAEGNAMGENVEIVGNVELRDALPSVLEAAESARAGRRHHPAIKEPLRLQVLPDRRSSRYTKPPDPIHGVHDGKEHIFIDEWGPYDFTSTRIIGPDIISMGSAQVRILAPGQPFYIWMHTPNVVVEPRRGQAPAIVTVRPAEGVTDSLHYTLGIRVDGKLLPISSGLILLADWDVKFYEWTPDLDPRESDENWQRIIAAPPIHTDRPASIDYIWYHRGPAPGLATDRFAAVATATIKLPGKDESSGRTEPTRLRVKTISDDGVRVYVNGETVIDNWTWHAPKEDTATVSVPDSMEVRIEYFEIDGHAQLQFFVELE